MSFSKKEIVQLYKPEIDLLTNLLWKSSKNYKENPYRPMPQWFEQIMMKRAEGMLSIALSVNYPWVVFPEYANNFSLIIFKKENAEVIQKLKRLQMRYFKNLDAEKSDEFARKATSIYNSKLVSKDKVVIKLEDEFILLFSFPTKILRSVLITLGAPEDISF